MKRSALIFLFLILFTVGVLARDQSERDKNGLKGKVKTVENYETYFWGQENNRISGSRNLAGLSIYNKKGDLLELWLLTNDANGSYYERQIYTYDDHRRKKTAVIYKSGKTQREKYFSTVRSPSGEIVVLPRLDQNLYRKIVFRYDNNGRLIDEVKTDVDDMIIERRISEFNASGNMIKHTVIKADGTVEYESLTLFFDDGRRSESTTIENNSELQRSITFKNENGTVVRSEGYVNLPLNGSGNKKKFVLHNRMTYTYLPDSVNAEWKFFKPNGDPESKLMIVQQHNEEVSRKSYAAGPLPAGSQNENVEPVWTTRESTFHKHQFDTEGNLVRHDWIEQKSPDSVLFHVYIFENILTYY